MEPSVSILVELPESLHSSLAQFLENHPGKIRDDVFTSAIALFLLQNHFAQGDGTFKPSEEYRKVSAIYLNSILKSSEVKA